MKVIYFISGLGIGGAERQLCDLADQLSRMGHEILIVSITGDTIFLPKNPAIKVVELRVRRPFFLNVIQSSIRINKLIRDFKPDIVHSHMFHAIIFLRLLRLFIPMPVLICTSHCLSEFSKWRMLAYRFTDRLCDFCTNVSEAAQIEFIRKGAWSTQKSTVIYNGIDINRFHFDQGARKQKRRELLVDDSIIIVLAVGRLVDEKDYPNLLRAFASCVSKRQNLILLIIGNGPLLSELKNLTGHLQITDKVIFLGESKDAALWMSAADIFVLSSIYEGFGLVVAEAMATGLSVISTDCGAAPTIMGNYGTIVPINNSKALTEAMLNTISGLLKHTRSDKIAEAREGIINHYSIDSVATKWVDLYESLGKSVIINN